MSVMLQSFTPTNPSRTLTLFVKRPPMALRPSPMFGTSARLESIVRPHRLLVTAAHTAPLRGLGLRLLPFHSQGLKNRSVFSFAAAHEESKPTEIEADKEKSDINVGDGESQEAWKETLAAFKEQALKMQSVSQEAYELYSKKAMVILKETSDQLKIQAEKARCDLSSIAKEISEDSKEYLSTAAEKSPEPVKDIVETFATSTDDVKEISKLYDFYLGIPYGVLLSFGGFLSFMLTGSISAIRFGVILGGSLLALSISSLRAWKRGEKFPLALKGQAAISSILFLREIRLLFERSSLSSYCTVLLSGAMVAFYLYRITMNGGLAKESNVKHGTEN